MPAVREASPHDRDAIHAVHALAFAGSGEAERVARLAVELIDEPAAIHFVAEDSGEVVGHVAFSPVAFDGVDRIGWMLAPLAVKPDCQRGGIGSKLVRAGLERLREADVVIVYGDPAYYGRFGFDAETAQTFTPPYELEMPFGWLAKTEKANRLPEQAVGVSCVPALCDPTLW